MAESRLIRIGILTSEPVNSLTWGGEVFYRRLMSVVDDYGLYDGRVGVLRGSLYPLQLDKVGDRDVEKWLDECSSAALVTKYASDGKQYLKLEKFGQRLRAKISKYPHPNNDDPPPFAASGGAPPRVAAETETETETDVETETDAPKVGGVDRPNEIESAFVGTLLGQINWLVPAQMSPKTRDELIALVVAVGPDESREILEKAPIACDKKVPKVWLAWSMSTMANKLAERIEPKRKPIPTTSPTRPSLNRKAAG